MGIALSPLAFAFTLNLLSGLIREGDHLTTALVAEIAGIICLVVGGLAASRIVYSDICGATESATGWAYIIGETRK